MPAIGYEEFAAAFGVSPPDVASALLSYYDGCGAADRPRAKQTIFNWNKVGELPTGNTDSRKFIASFIEHFAREHSGTGDATKIQALRELLAGRSSPRVPAPRIDMPLIGTRSVTDVSRFAEFIQKSEKENRALAARRKAFSGYFHVVRKTTDPDSDFFHCELFYFGKVSEKTWLVTSGGEVHEGFSFMTSGISVSVLARLDNGHEPRGRGVEFHMYQAYTESSDRFPFIQCANVRVSDELNRPVASKVLLCRIAAPNEELKAFNERINQEEAADTDELTSERVARKEADAHKPREQRGGGRVVVDEKRYAFYSALLSPSDEELRYLRRGVWKPEPEETWRRRVSEAELLLS